MGSRRSRKAKAREMISYQIEDIFEKISAEREGRSENKETEQEKIKTKERENPNHPCYKCIGCAGWTKCPGYYQLMECIEQRKRAYERKLAGL